MPSRDIHCADDARQMARRRLPWMVFDYIDGAAGEGHGEALNRAALRDLRLKPRVLCNVTHRDLSMPVFDHPAKVPFGITPMGMCNLTTPGADLMLARIAARDRVPLGVSTVASTALEKMLEVAEGHAWFQLYFSGDGSATMQLVERARAAGYQTLVVTLDVPE
ncbi:MAG: alpha-hydroxy-acid oxidizing protein, partial [Roseovarius sp.]|nr:alpha-hydroxy-acid oxidizing protein [Roseovarius sp.]